MKKAATLALGVMMTAALPSMATASTVLQAPAGTSYLQSYRAVEITDKKVLLDRAEKGIHEGDVQFSPQMTVKNNATGQAAATHQVKKIYTSQKLGEDLNLLTGQKVEHYKATTFYTPTKTQHPTTAGEVTADSLIDNGQDYDPTISVMATNTVYYDYILVNGGEKALKFYEIDAKWDRLDTQVSWSGAKIGYLQQGGAFDINGNMHGGVTYGSWKTVGIPSSGTTYAQYPPSSNYYVDKGNLDEMGEMQITLSRGSSTWTFLYQNLVK